MKLKKSAEPETIAPMPATGGGAVIADRFKLDVDDGAAKGPAGVGKTSALIALVVALLSLVLLGGVAWMLYQNWEFLQNA